MSSTITIRILDSADAAQFQRLRLQALQESPTAFASSFADEAATPLSEIAVRLKPDPDWSWVLGASADSQELVGMVGFRRDRGLKHNHKAMLWGMYVAPENRGRGVGRRLVEEFMARARAIDGLRQVKLTVNPAQIAATRLYSSLGFQRFGREPDAFKVGDRFFDEDYMILRVRGDTGVTI